MSSGEPFSVGAEDRGTLHDFDPTAGIDYLQSVTIPVGATFTMVAQWDQPFASNCAGCPGAANDVDIYLVEEAPNGSLSIVTSSVSDNLTSGEPVEVLQFGNPGIFFGTEFQIMIAHYDVVTAQHPQPGSPPTLMKYVWFGQSTITVNEYNTNSPASYGHANSAGAAAVGAAFYGDTPAFGAPVPLLESFSSKGGVPILFDVLGNSLGVPGPREKPEFVAPDGTNTTFFFRDTSLDTDPNPQLVDPGYPYTEFPNFFGTSAAAPHAAAIAALMLEANPALTPGDIYSILKNTAVDMDTPGFDFNTGYGLINAGAAIAQATGNLFPVAVNDNAATDQNTLVSIPVLANDAPGDPLTVISIEFAAAHGTAFPNVNGTHIDYTPAPDYFGPDSFQYRITDNDGQFSIATVNVTVNEIDIEPIAVNDNAATNEDTLLAGIAVMGNDVPLGNAPTTITAAGPGKPGSTVSIAPDGSTIAYDPAPNDFGLDTFPYTITDGDGDFANANVTVTINPVNDPPVADNDATSTNEDTQVVFNDALMLAGDTDIENDPLSVALVFGTSAQGGTVTSVGGNHIYTPPANFNGVDAVNYLVSDGASTDTGSVVITVNAVNDAPDAATVANQNSQDGDAAISVDTSTTDIENDTLSYLVSGQPAGLTINAATGLITGTIDANASSGGPALNGIYTVTVTASDATLSTNYQFTWTVTAVPANKSPNPGLVANQFNSDADIGISINAATTDPDGDTLTYSISGQPAGVTINATSGLISGNLANDASLGSVYIVTVTASDSISTPTNYQFNWTVTDPAPNATTVANQINVDGNSAISVNAATTDPDGDTLTYSVSGQPSGLSINAITGVISGTLANNASQGGVSGAHTVIVTANDGTTPTNYQFTWTVSNPVPAAAADTAVTNEDTAVIVNVLSNDSDTAPDSDTLTVSSVTQGANGSVVNNGGNVTYTPNPNYNGGDSFNYTVSDGNGGTDTGTVTVTVNPVNDAPVAAADSATTDQGVGVVIDVLSNDSDVDGDGLSVSGVTNGANGTVTNNAGSNVTYTPSGGFTGGDSFTYDVSDGNGGVDTATVNVTVNAVNVTPADAPTNVSATNLGGGIAHITWDDSNTNEDGFELEREKLAGNGAWKSTTLLGPIAALTYDDASGKGTFHYRVRATNGSGTGPWSVWDDVVVTSGAGPGNSAPTASFTYSCTGLDCGFDGSGSTDSDGTIASYSWDYGDGNVDSGVTPAMNHVYAAAGTYTVILTVTDDLGANGQDSQNVMVVDPAAGISLSATGYKVKGTQTVDLNWGGAASTHVDIVRSGSIPATVLAVPNSGAYTDDIGVKGGGSYNYVVCEAGTTICSDPVDVVF